MRKKEHMRKHKKWKQHLGRRSLATSNSVRSWKWDGGEYRKERDKKVRKV